MSEAIISPNAAELIERPSRIRRLAVGRMRYPFIQLLALLAFVSVWQLLHLTTKEGVLPGPGDALPKFVDIVSTGMFVEPLWATLVALPVWAIAGVTSVTGSVAVLALATGRGGRR